VIALGVLKGSFSARIAVTVTSSISETSMSQSFSACAWEIQFIGNREQAANTENKKKLCAFINMITPVPL
jgi:hypothetical protein